MAIWTKKVLAVFMEWDYGIRARGDSIEKSCFLSSLRELVQDVDVFWYDDFLTAPAQLQDAVVARARQTDPDLIIFIPYSDQFTYATLDALKRDFPTYAWFGDDQWRFDEYTSLYAPHFSYVSTTDPWSIPKYRQRGIDPILTQWAAYPHATVRGPIFDERDFEYDVTFIGGANRYRLWFVARLRQLGIQVTCFGAGWPGGRVDNTEMERVFRSSRINLNISNSACYDIRYLFSNPLALIHFFRSAKRVEQMKARNFEIPLAGGFQLTNYVPCLERYLTVGDEVAIYTTLEECVGQIRYYLTEAEERQAIAVRGHAKAIAEHTYRHRLELILGRIWGE
jgi:spore maturation protein CgeB